MNEATFSLAFEGEILMNKACPEITDNMASYINGEKLFLMKKNILFAAESNFEVKLWKEKVVFVLFVF